MLPVLFEGVISLHVIMQEHTFQTRTYRTSDVCLLSFGQPVACCHSLVLPLWRVNHSLGLTGRLQKNMLK